MRLGIIVGLTERPEEALGKARDLDLPTCQLSCWRSDILTAEMAERVKAATKETGVEITSVWAGWSGPAVWDFYDGPLTLGLVPATYRAQRIRDLNKASDFARMLGVDSITTHVGFIPENPNDPTYREVIIALRDVARYCSNNGQVFCFETGQETPVTLVRAFDDIGLDNLGVNLDPANLIMYGKANPVDAMDILGPYIKGVHAKDGEYPTCGQRLGVEKPLGEGRVDFRALIKELKRHDYRGALTIEREISGSQQIKDIERAKKLLLPLL
ncbi:MAG: sugar phosphate isomerase/epimerase [Firmicutes bacterium]|nr:sugar phosphate isomerase/epimerase [Bacillota bacterium]